MSGVHCSLVLLAWNGWALTRRALDSLLATELCDSDVIVVDNGSSDATAEGLLDYAGRIRVVRLPENLGYVRGNNAGIAAADDGDIVLLNNDLQFVQRDWLLRMQASAYSADTIGLVGCRLVDANGLLLHAGSLVLPDTCVGVQIASGRQEPDIGQYASPARAVQGVVFAAVYIKRSVIDAIGVLDTAYDTYFEDSDYCLRAAQAGYASVLCGEATLIHHQHGSTGLDAQRRERLHAQGRSVFTARWKEALLGQYRHRLLWQSSLEFPAASALLSRPLLRALDRAGVELRYESLYQRVLPEALAESGDSRDFVLNTLRARSHDSSPATSVSCGDPALFRHARGDWRIGYAGFEQLPTGLASQDWMQPDELWLPSAWHRDQLREASVDRPMSVVPEGIDLDYYHPGIRRIDNPYGEFVFLCVAAWDEIDRPWLVIETFVNAFRRDQPIRLLCWIDAPGRDLGAEIDRLQLDPHGGRVSFLAPGELTERHDAVVYRSADASLSLSRSRQRVSSLLRAMATGTPAIALALGAAAEVLHESDSYIIPDSGEHSIEAATNCKTALADRMREVLSDRVQAAARGLAASARIHATRGWDRIAAQIVERLAQIGAAPAPRVARAAHGVPQGRVIVLGMHRSGTSCVAGLLQLMGLFGARGDQWLPRAADNPRGHFERVDLHNALVAALRERGGDWSIPLGWDEDAIAASRERLQRAWQTIREELEPQSPWFIKEPRLCLLLPELIGRIDTPICVHVVRDPSAVARSLRQRDGLTVPHALALWEHYNLAALEASHGQRRVWVDYDALLSAPLETARRLHADLQHGGVHGLREPADAEIAAWVRGPPRIAVPPALPMSVWHQRLWQALRDPRSGVDEKSSHVADPESTALLLRLAEEHRQVRRREQGLNG